MKRFYGNFVKRTLLSMLIVHLSLLSFAATYYVSSAGNDSNSGLSEALAWKTLAKVSSKTFAAGDRILLKRGDTWRESLYCTSSGSNNNRIVYSNYGTGNKPRILGSKIATTWTNQGGNVWKTDITFAGNTQNVFFIKTDLSVATGVAKTSLGTLTAEFDWWKDANYIYVYAVTNPSSRYNSVEIPVRDYPIGLSNKQYIEINGIDCFYAGVGIYESSSPSENVKGLIVRNCEIAYMGYPDGNGVGIHAFYSNSLFENNVIHDCGRRGISLIIVTNSFNIKNVVIQNNTFYNGYHTTSVDMQLTTGYTGSIDSIFIRKNLIYDDPNRAYVAYPMSMFLSRQANVGSTITNVFLEYNVFKYVAAPGIYFNGVNSAFMYNNTFYGHSTTHTGQQAFITADGSKLKFRNNIFYDQQSTDAGNKGLIYYFGTGQSIDSDYNIFYRTSKSLKIAYANNTLYSSNDSTKLRTALGNEIHSKFVDPKFVSTTDLSLQSVSKAINSGVNVGLTNDFYGSSVVGLPDIGANECATAIDTGKPVVTGFTIPSTSTTLSISISTFTATDNIGVTGYLLTETSSVPTSGTTGWSATKPTTYVFTTVGTKTLYAWVKDATGNISASLNASVTISTPTASSFTFGGPSTGNVNSASSTFTVTPNNTYTGTITLTPSGAGSVGLSAKVLTFSSSSTAQTFTITPTVAGSITLTPTNNGSLTNPANITYTTNAIVPGAPTSIVAIAGNASASVTFVAPANNGGSAITGYTVTSVPAGGVDSNAGLTSLTHTITGLTNGTSYTFYLKAANSVGTSVASVASNSVIPKAPVATSFLFTGPSTGSVNSASSNFTVTPNNTYTGTITVTPSGVGSAGLSSKVLTFTNSSTAQIFTIAPTVAGSITLTPTNSGSLTNPVPITYTTNAVVSGAPTSVVATSGNSSASVTFVAPANNGGSAITGYTVTSVPAGGIDSNAGSTSLTHTITGLTNGTSYTFTVKATNSAGTSVASAASNSIIPVEVVVIKQGDITPSHFTTVWQGLNGLNHMNIIVASATMEDFPLSVGDEIAVFSGSACVGTAKLTKSIVPTDNTSFLTILASQSDGSTNGFIENDTILFKVWDNTNKVEKLINGAVYRNDVATWKTTGRYVPGSTSMVEITSYPIYTQSIELLKGYNMISTYVSAPDPSASVVTKTLVDQGNLIKMQDETGNSFENWGDFGGWINQLGALEKTEGYKIQVANNCTLQVTGRPIAMPLNISLKTGWNIISYPRTDVVSAMNVVQALIDQNKLVKVQDEAGNSIENWGLFGGWKNGIGNFIPGKAYKVKMSADAVLAFLESYPKSAVVIAHSEPTEYYHSSLEGHGTDHMNINITDLNRIGISVGDELAAFDGAVCVATTKITEANLLSGSACLVSSFSTDNQNPNGFKVGNPIQISLWSKLSSNESKVTSEVITGQMKYEKNSSVLVKMKSTSIATGIIDLEDVIKIDVFPNPCQSHVSVRFSEIPEVNSRIEISDISGRKLISRLVTGTSEEFNLDSFVPGLYLVKSILGKSEHIHKLIVNK